MKKLTLLLSAALILFSCKKEEPAPQPAPPASPQSGTAHIQLEAWDSMGVKLAAVPDVKVLVGSNIWMVSSSVTVQYSTTYGDYFPSVVKDGFEGAPVKITINAPQVNARIPLAQRSGFRTRNLTALAVKRDSIVVNFDLDRAVPAGTSAKLALVAGSANSLSNSNYESADIFFTNTSTGNKVNIAKFARFKNYLASLDSNATFYLNVIPVSYGEYVSNVVVKPLLLGDNPFTPDNWLLKKEWKN